jgi:hypothetical protein
MFFHQSGSPRYGLHGDAGRCTIMTAHRWSQYGAQEYILAAPCWFEVLAVRYAKDFADEAGTMLENLLRKIRLPANGGG